MRSLYLNTKNTQIIATFFAHFFSSHHAGKYAIEEWIRAEKLVNKFSGLSFEIQFMETTNICRPDNYHMGNKLIGYAMNKTLVEFFDKYIAPNYQEIKEYVYAEMTTIMKLHSCETTEQYCKYLLTEMSPYTYDMNNVVDHIFTTYILKSDYRSKNDRFYERFPSNWLTDKEIKYLL